MVKCIKNSKNRIFKLHFIKQKNFLIKNYPRKHPSQSQKLKNGLKQNFFGTPCISIITMILFYFVKCEVCQCKPADGEQEANDIETEAEIKDNLQRPSI